ncbi:hypothetical protein CDD80_5602 [Ophiocordyceps camponoti-rufipedis]|uniref:SMP-LTD domain-containing protein n=1 Tax=Ophiocordyceps camponoti-rufipedis TaxID=2004952 RepID=A0A2C5YTZ6_9HYPO|nr:hypothetical protein CDD80_5602 [Ophiocordyceps camponoti-rufipedis]
MGTTSWTALLVAYFVGGVTLIPLVVAVVFVHGYYTFPRRDDVDPFSEDDHVEYNHVVDETSPLLPGESSKARPSTEAEVAAGYFAVCREYTPMGINAKPIERSTPLGSTTVASPSPSVYQTMYRSIFDRKPTATQDGNGLSQRPKKAGNVFYVVLRHGHLMLFDDDEQLEVRHVISLAHHDVSIYSGGDATPEGELFIKRNALCLSRRPDASDTGPTSKPFYLFSENCSAKEDFYFAMLRNQEQTFGFDSSAPRPKHFDVKSIIALVQRLHASEDHVHSRWLNAVIGRLFLAVYKTRDLENFIRDKITNKIARVKRPSFLTNITIQGIDTGEAAPYFTNLKLKDLTVEGECVVEADVRYTGNFRIQVGATVKIDLGARFKARQVNLVLAVVLRRVEGHVLFKIKAPPTNRLWTSFQTMPKMEMTIEPIVSSRQITYTVILRQIESRIKEVFAETLVQPSWDDVPFFRTEHKQWRGGIFEGDDAVENEEPAAAVDAVDEGDDGLEPGTVGENRPLDIKSQLPVEERTGLFGRKLGGGGSIRNGHQQNNLNVMSSSNSSSPALMVPATDSKPLTADGNKSSSTVTSPLRSPALLKRPTDPIVGTETAHADLFKPSSSPPDHATNYMTALRSRSQDASAHASPTKTLAKPPSRSSMRSEDRDTRSDAGSARPLRRRDTASSVDSSVEGGNSGTLMGRSLFQRRDTSESSSNGGEAAVKRGTLAAVTNAAVQARQWGWSAFQRQKDGRRGNGDRVDLSQPMGRGQPLPPPGVPLPGPADFGGRRRWAAAAEEREEKAEREEKVEREGKMDRGKTTEDKTAEARSEDKTDERHGQRPRTGSQEQTNDDEHKVLVVEAPSDSSQPVTPLADGKELLASRDATQPLVALPAKEEDEEDDDDYSGWMEDDVLDGHGAMVTDVAL